MQRSQLIILVSFTYSTAETGELRAGAANASAHWCQYAGASFSSRVSIEMNWQQKHLFILTNISWYLSVYTQTPASNFATFNITSAAVERAGSSASPRRGSNDARAAIFDVLHRHNYIDKRLRVVDDVQHKCARVHSTNNHYQAIHVSRCLCVCVSVWHAIKYAN